MNEQEAIFFLFFFSLEFEFRILPWLDCQDCQSQSKLKTILNFEMPRCIVILFLSAISALCLSILLMETQDRDDREKQD